MEFKIQIFVYMMSQEYVFLHVWCVHSAKLAMQAQLTVISHYQQWTSITEMGQMPA